MINDIDDYVRCGMPDVVRKAFSCLHDLLNKLGFLLNRMHDLLPETYGKNISNLTLDFMRDLRWFTKFLTKYHCTSIYNHRPVDFTVELDTCLMGLDGRWDNFVYHLPLPLHYKNLTRVHLEMVNILVALMIFAPNWAKRKVLRNWDNHAVVQVLTNSRTKDQFLGACARNIWYFTGLYDIDMTCNGKNSVITDALSRWQNSEADRQLFLHRCRTLCGWLSHWNSWNSTTKYSFDKLWCCTLFCRFPGQE